VIVERRGRTLVVTINRPAARNSVNLAVSRGLADAVDELDGDPQLSVGIVTGAGGNFSAGMDLKAFAAGENVALPGRGLGFTEQPPKKPMIAAVEGSALAGGAEIVLAADIVVAARTAKFGLPEVKRGMVAGGGGILRLPERIPRSRALELLFTGDTFTAEQGHEWGLVNTVTDTGQALSEALRLADRITANGPLAVAATKAIVAESSDWGSHDMWKKQLEIMLPVFTSNDAREGAVAFAEKREPRWSAT
jgi:enoyl-CoA hydratase